MSLSAISSNPMTGSTTASFRPHHKGAHGVNTTATASPTSSNSGALGNTSGVTIGQLPVGASSPLFNNILQSLQETVGEQTAVTAAASSPAATSSGTAPASGTAAAASSTTNVHAFMHTLFQALKQDGFDPGAGAASSAATASAASPASSAPSVSSSLVSSLKTLIGQVGSGAAVTPAAASLSAAYQTLVGASGAAAGTSAGNGATSSSVGGLQHFLGNLLQNLQSGGVHALSAIGNNVNANV